MFTFYTYEHTWPVVMDFTSLTDGITAVVTSSPTYSKISENPFKINDCYTFIQKSKLQLFNFNIRYSNNNSIVFVYNNFLYFL